MLADISEPTLELLVAITTDPTVHIPSAISQTNKQIKRIGDELRIASPETIRGAQSEQVLKDWNKLQNERVQFLRLMEAVKSRQTNVEQALKQQVKSTIAEHNTNYYSAWERAFDATAPEEVMPGIYRGPSWYKEQEQILKNGQMQGTRNPEE